MLQKTLNDPAFHWAPAASGTDSYAVNGLNQYSTVGGRTLSYDGNGNLTNDGAGRGFVYDAENVLRSASGLAGGEASYRYHADGSRREKSYNASSSEFYYMGGLGYLDDDDVEFAADQEIAEYDGAELLRRYMRLPGSVDEAFLMVDYTREAVCANTSYAACEVWAHQNRLGSVVATTNSAGSVLEQYTYSPYGVSGAEGDGGLFGALAFTP